MERRSKEKTIKLEIYTDGSCHKWENKGTGIGAWAFLVIENTEKIYYATSEVGDNLKTTNQRMELKAAIAACEWAEKWRTKNQSVIVYSDSAYLVNAFNQRWIDSWRSHGWRNSKGQDVANQDLWLELLPFYDNYHYSFIKVKGHGENMWNNETDRLANEVIQNTINRKQ